MEGSLSAGSAASQARAESESGLLTGKQVGLAAATGAGTAAFTLVGGKVANYFGVPDLDTLLSTPMTSKARASLAKIFVVGAITEGVFEEMPQSVQESSSSSSSSKRTAPWARRPLWSLWGTALEISRCLTTCPVTSGGSVALAT